jgi:16S rRNA G1207 methylase RsmC
MPSPEPEVGADPAEHYFTPHPRARSHPRELRFLYRGELLRFRVDAAVFAAHGLDPGTSLLIESTVVGEADRVLDLGCGWGAIGVAAAKAAPRGYAVLTDVNHRAVGLARQNLVTNDVKNAEVREGPLFGPVEGERFDLIATNPPYHAGRPLLLELLDAARVHLAPGGRLVLVGKGSQGVLFYQRWLAEHWGGSVEVIGRRSGYRVLEARPGLENRAR